MSACHIPFGLSTGERVGTLLGVVVQTALYAGLGAAIGLIVAGQAAAAVVALVGFGVVEPLVSATLGPARALSFSGVSDALLGMDGGGSVIAGAGVLVAWLPGAAAGRCPATR